MSERITAANLDEVVKKNAEIHDDLIQKAIRIRTTCDTMQVRTPSRLAFQLLKPYGLIQMPIKNRYWSGAIFVKNNLRIPVINTALPRANQYFAAWHEIYHLFFDEVSFDHVIETEASMEERKAEYFASLMLLGNLMPYYTELSDSDFLSKVFCCMDLFQAPYKAVLISLYESGVRSENAALKDTVKQYFDLQIPDIAIRFRSLGLDDTLVKPSYIVNIGCLSAKINSAIEQNPESSYHKDNAAFLTNVTKEINRITGDVNE